MPKTMREIMDATKASLYKADEHEWIARQVEALRAGDLSQIDRRNLIDYLTEMTVRDRRELQSRLTVLLMHLLKTQIQPGQLTRSWIGPLLEQQREIQSIMDGIPSLGRQAENIAVSVYPNAVRAAARETGISADRFPRQSPWTVEQALAFDPPEPPNRTHGRRK